jgi:hypothetical protein
MRWVASQNPFRLDKHTHTLRKGTWTLLNANFVEGTWKKR